MGKDLNDFYFTVLTYLSDYGIGIQTDISTTLRKYFHNTKEVDITIYQARVGAIVVLLRNIETNGHIQYSTNRDNSDITSIFYKDGNYSVAITQAGLDYLYSHNLHIATLLSYKNQKWVNRITWLISCVSVSIALFFGLKSNSLETQVQNLQKRLDTIEKTVSNLSYSTPKVHDHDKKSVSKNPLKEQKP